MGRTGQFAGKVREFEQRGLDVCRKEIARGAQRWNRARYVRLAKVSIDGVVRSAG